MDKTALHSKKLTSSKATKIYTQITKQGQISRLQESAGDYGSPEEGEVLLGRQIWDGRREVLPSSPGSIKDKDDIMLVHCLWGLGPF